MEQPEHIELARTYLSASVRLEVDGIHQLASEAVWGAVSMAVDACRHSHLLGHGNFGEKRRFISRLAAADSGPLDLEFAFHQAQVRLHNHFYTNRLSVEQASYWLLLGRVFVERLLSIAETPGNQAGTA